MTDREVGIILFLFGFLGGSFSAVCWMSIRDGERHAEIMRERSVKPKKPTVPTDGGKAA